MMNENSHLLIPGSSTSSSSISHNTVQLSSYQLDIQTGCKQATLYKGNTDSGALFPPGVQWCAVRWGSALPWLIRKKKEI